MDFWRSIKHLTGRLEEFEAHSERFGTSDSNLMYHCEEKNQATIRFLDQDSSNCPRNIISFLDDLKTHEIEDGLTFKFLYHWTVANCHLSVVVDESNIASGNQLLASLITSFYCDVAEFALQASYLLAHYQASDCSSYSNWRQLMIGAKNYLPCLGTSIEYCEEEVKHDDYHAALVDGQVLLNKLLSSTSKDNLMLIIWTCLQRFPDCHYDTALSDQRIDFLYTYITSIFPRLPFCQPPLPGGEDKPTLPDKLCQLDLLTFLAGCLIQLDAVGARCGSDRYHVPICILSSDCRLSPVQLHWWRQVVASTASKKHNQSSSSAIVDRLFVQCGLNQLRLNAEPARCTGNRPFPCPVPLQFRIGRALLNFASSSSGIALDRRHVLAKWACRLLLDASKSSLEGRPPPRHSLVAGSTIQRRSVTNCSALAGRLGAKNDLHTSSNTSSLSLGKSSPRHPTQSTTNQHLLFALPDQCGWWGSSPAGPSDEQSWPGVALMAILSVWLSSDGEAFDDQPVVSRLLQLVNRTPHLPSDLHRLVIAFATDSRADLVSAEMLDRVKRVASSNHMATNALVNDTRAVALLKASFVNMLDPAKLTPINQLDQSDDCQPTPAVEENSNTRDAALTSTTTFNPSAASASTLNSLDEELLMSALLNNLQLLVQGLSNQLAETKTELGENRRINQQLSDQLRQTGHQLSQALTQLSLCQSELTNQLTLVKAETTNQDTSSSVAGLLKSPIQELSQSLIDLRKWLPEGIAAASVAAVNASRPPMPPPQLPPYDLNALLQQLYIGPNRHLMQPPPPTDPTWPPSSAPILDGQQQPVQSGGDKPSLVISYPGASSSLKPFGSSTEQQSTVISAPRHQLQQPGIGQWQSTKPDVIAGSTPNKSLEQSLRSSNQSSFQRNTSLEVNRSNSSTVGESPFGYDYNNMATSSTGDLMAKFAPKPGSWGCPACMINNPATALKCRACETDKPGGGGDSTKTQTSNKPSSIALDSVSSTPTTSAVGPGGIKQGGFVFGQPLSQTSQPVTNKPPLTSFAASTTKPAAIGTGPSSGLFSFGQASSTTTSTATIPSYSFATSTNKPTPTAIGTGSSSFSLGLSSSTTTTNVATTLQPFTIPSTAAPSSSAMFPTTLAPTHPQQAPAACTGDDDDAVEQVEEDRLQFKPVLDRLPHRIAVVTGEEGLEVLFCQRAKLFRLVGEAWKERGVGDMKLLKSPIDGSVRCLLRRDHIHKLACNHLVANYMRLTPLTGAAIGWRWMAIDFSEPVTEEEESSDNIVNGGRREMFACRFKQQEHADEFKFLFEAASASASITSSPESRPVGDGDTSTASTIDRSHDSSPEVISLSDYAQEVSPSQIQRARQFKLPDNFYAFENGYLIGEREQLAPDEESEEDVQLAAASASKQTDLDDAKTPTGGNKSAGDEDVKTPIATDNSCGRSAVAANSSSSNTNTPSLRLFGTPSQVIGTPSFGSSSKLVDFASLGASVSSSQKPTWLSPSTNLSKVDWAQAGQPLFATATTAKSPPNNEANNDDDTHDPHFEPIVNLPEIVQIRTGEEGEVCLFRCRCRLYRFQEAAWKERGIGEMKVLVTLGHVGDYPTDGLTVPANQVDLATLEWGRLLMRREQVLKVCVNQPISKEVPGFKPMTTGNSTTSLCWVAEDFSDQPSSVETLAVKFKLETDAQQFKKVIGDIQHFLGSK